MHVDAKTAKTAKTAKKNSFGGLAALVVAFACAGAPAGPATPRCAGGSVQTKEQLESLAGCERIDGDLSISGAAIADLEPLVATRAVAGDLTLGPTSRLGVSRGLRNLTRVEGSLRVAHNFALGGLYLASLREVGGDIEIEGNVSLLAASLHALRSVGGDIEVAGNGALERLDLSALAEVGGALRVDGSSDLVVAVPEAADVRGGRHIAPSD